MICTSSDCHKETSLYLCTDCIVELDDLLQDVPALIVMLQGAREGTAVVRKAGSGGGGGVTGSKPPGSLDAMLLQGWLQTLPARAHAAATDFQNAGEWLYMARIWVNHARDLVYGPEAEVLDHAAIAERVKEANGKPMLPREVRDYLRKKTRLTIKSKDFENWVQLGKLRYVFDRVTTEEKPRRMYFPGEVFRISQEMRDRRTTRV